MDELEKEGWLESQKWLQNGIQLHPESKMIPEMDGLDKGWLQSQMAMILNVER